MSKVTAAPRPGRSSSTTLRAVPELHRPRCQPETPRLEARVFEQRLHPLLEAPRSHPGAGSHPGHRHPARVRSTSRSTWSRTVVSGVRSSCETRFSKVPSPARRERLVTRDLEAGQRRLELLGLGCDLPRQLVQSHSPGRHSPRSTSAARLVSRRFRTRAWSSSAATASPRSPSPVAEQPGRVSMSARAVSTSTGTSAVAGRDRSA